MPWYNDGIAGAAIYYWDITVVNQYMMIMLFNDHSWGNYEKNDHILIEWYQLVMNYELSKYNIMYYVIVFK